MTLQSSGRRPSVRVLALAAVAAGAFALGLWGASRWWSVGSSRDAAVQLAALPLGHPAPAGARLPHLAHRPGGGIVLSWVESDAGGHVLKFAELAGTSWTAPQEVARGNSWFVNWLDFPSVAPIDRDFWVAHWLVRRAGGGTYDYDIALAVSGDGGRTWRGPLRPYQTGTAAEYGFASIFPDGGSAGIVWLDGRDFIKPADRPQHPDKSGNFALRYTRVHRDGRIEPDAIIDSNVCACCQTVAAITPDGPVVAYRGRTDAEVRDNQLAVKRGASWSPGAPLGKDGWVIAGCPTNGPAIAARGSNVAAAWFTGAHGNVRVRAAFSHDGGRTLGPVIELDGQAPVGRLGIEWIDDRTAVAAWIGRPVDGRDDAPLRLRTMQADGALSAPMQIVRISASRDTGLPQLLADGGKLVLAWTEPRPSYGIRLVTVPISLVITTGAKTR